jgi:hypothetical protein
MYGTWLRGLRQDTTMTSRWVPRALIAFVAVFTVWILWVWFQNRAMENAAREQAMPACMARLGDEATCRDHVAAYHDDCVHYAHVRPGRYEHKQERIDMDKYVDCIVLGVDGWFAQAKQKRQDAERERLKDQYPR